MDGPNDGDWINQNSQDHFQAQGITPGFFIDLGF